MSGDITVKDLSPDQRAAYDSVVKWASAPDREVLTLAGFAGTGKSTVVSLVAESLPPPVAFCAYTGKASSVLKRKLQASGIYTVGVQKANRDGGQSLNEQPYCGTIHSLIYRPCECREPKEVVTQKPCPARDCGAETSWLGDGIETACADGHRGRVKSRAAFDNLEPHTSFVYASKGPDGVCTKCGGKDWIRRDMLDRAYSIIIVDEASMVDDAMLRDLRSYGTPILAVGDHGQLPPVGGTGSLMRDPHIRLEKIHRQAEGNSIIALSKLIRETGRLPEEFDGGAHVKFGRLRFVEGLLEERYVNASPARLLEMTSICYTNRRRLGLNTMVRRILGHARTGRELPRVGEHVVCLRNIKPKGGLPPIYNGMRGVLTRDTAPKPMIEAFTNEKIGESEVQLTGAIEFPDDGIEAREFVMCRGQFGREKTFAQPEELQREVGVSSFEKAGSLFDFGWAMTAHKMQGSQVDDLVVLVERPGPVDDDSWRRWLYTATTRAASKLTLLR